MRNKQRWAVVAVCVGLVALVWFVFGQTVRFPFINFDDPEYVYEVPEINSGLTLHGLNWAVTRMPSPTWSPLTNISHMVVAQFYGMNPSGYHLVNVVLHVIAVILLALVLWQGTGNLWPSAFVAAVFAIHPLRVESVAWITERKDVLSGVFFMLTLGAYFFYARKPGILRYLLVLVAHACGLLSKPMLVTTPAVLLLLDYWPLRRMRSAKGEARSLEVSSQWSVVRGLVFEKIPLFVLSALSAWATIAIQTVAESSFVPPSLFLRIKNALVSILIYIKETFWPADLSVLYPHPREHLNNWVVLVAALLIIGITCVAIIVRHKRPYIIVGWFWYLVMLSPVLGIVQAGKQAHADRFTYLPQIGLLIAITWTVVNLRKTTITEPQRLSSIFDLRTSIFSICFVAIVFALALSARAQVSYWRDSELLWSHAIAVTKDNAFAHASLADLLLRRGRIDEAIDHCRETLKINPRDADAHNNLGLALLQKGNEKDAAAEFEESLEIDPNQMNAAPNLAWILATSPDPATRNGARAVELAERVSQHAGHPNAIVLRTLAAAYAEAGRFPDAINAAEAASELAKAQGNAGLAEDLQRAVSNYKAGLPIRSYVSPR